MAAASTISVVNAGQLGPPAATGGDETNSPTTAAAHNPTTANADHKSFLDFVMMHSPCLILGRIFKRHHHELPPRPGAVTQRPASTHPNGCEQGALGVLFLRPLTSRPPPGVGCYSANTAFDSAAAPMSTSLASITKTLTKHTAHTSELRPSQPAAPFLGQRLRAVDGTWIERTTTFGRGVGAARATSCQPRVNEQKERHLASSLSARLRWLRGPDLNRRPSGYEPDELPDCSTPRAPL